jgi:hypothetical protein
MIGKVRPDESAHAGDNNAHDAMVEPPDRPSTFESLAAILSPVDATRAAVVHANDRWSVDRAAMAGASEAVWGRLPAAGRGALGSLRHALRRDLALGRLRLRPPSGLAVTRVHRLPAAPHAGRFRNAVRSLLLGGVAVELSSSTPARPRRLDSVFRAAAIDPSTVRSMSVARDGSVRCLARSGNERVLLRVALESSGKRPRRSARALEALAATGIRRVPRSLGDGLVDGAEWTLESVEAGRIPDRLGPTLWQEVVQFAATLHAGGRPRGVEDQIAAVAIHAGDLAAPLRRLAWRSASVDLPAVVQHGDLCRDNLLVTRGQLRAVVDWESWHGAGTPGVDLLELFASERMRASGEHPIDLWLGEIWTDPLFLRLTSNYWRALDIPVDRETLWAVGVAWWVNQLSTELQRPERTALRSDAAWIRSRVEATLKAMVAGDRSRPPAPDDQREAEHSHDDD